MAVTCPKCGFQQESGTECLRCRVIFARYKPPPPSSPEPPAAAADPVAEAEALAPSRRLVSSFLSIFPWAALATAVGVLFLIFRQSPPLPIQTDPKAPERVEAKMAQFQMAVEAGRPHALMFNEAELNAWMQANLVLAPPATGAEAAASVPTPPVEEPTVEEVKSAMKDVRINLSGDRLRAYALFDFHGRNLSLLLEGNLLVLDGHLRLEPTSGKLGSLPIPKAILDTVVSRLFDSPKNRDKFQLAPHIGNISVENSELIVSYR